MSEGDPSISAAEALRALALHARLERMRGVRYWWDAELGDRLRELVRTVGSEPARSPLSRPAAAIPSGSVREGAATPSNGQPLPQEGASSARSAQGAPSNGRQRQETPSNVRQQIQWPMPPLAAGRDAQWHERLEGVAARARACTACELCKTRNKVVFGVGSAAVPLVFVGEAPGADEDRQGIPFVGKAGQLLTRIISAIGLEREEVYICNVLKCRPPGNRNPAPDEIVQCSPFLREQLDILKPKVICTLGLFASQFLLDTKVPIGRLRGRVSDYRGIPVVPTYHPAALLRDPSLKSAVWEDVQLVRRILDA